MKRLVVWYGELALHAQLMRRGWLFLLPALLWLGGFLLLPSFALVVVALAERGTYGEVVWNFSLENLRRAMGYGLFGWSPDYLLTLARSVGMALFTTLFCAALAFPLAFFIARQPPRLRYLWLAAVIIPFWTNLVIRTYAWQLLLSPELPLAKLAAGLGLVEAGAALYPSTFAVMVGMVSAFLPFMVLPLYASVERLDKQLIEAAQDLYASRVRVFFQAIWPQTLPGLSVGIVLTLVPAMGMFVIPDLLGGGKYLMVGNLIQQQFGSSRDWPLAAALSLSLMALTLLALQVFRRRAKEVDWL